MNTTRISRAARPLALGFGALTAAVAATLIVDNALAPTPRRCNRPSYKLLPGIGPAADADVIFVCMHGLWSRYWGPLLDEMRQFGQVLLVSNGDHVDQTPADAVAWLQEHWLPEHDAQTTTVIPASFSLGTLNNLIFRRLYEEATGVYLQILLMPGAICSRRHVKWPHPLVPYGVRFVYGGPIADYCWRRSLRNHPERASFSAASALSGARLLNRGIEPTPDDFRAGTWVLIIQQEDDHRIHPGYFGRVASNANVTGVLIPTPGHVDFDNPAYAEAVRDWLGQVLGTAAAPAPAEVAEVARLGNTGGSDDPAADLPLAA